MKEYMIHDNGARPYKVTISKKAVNIYKHHEDEDLSDYDEDDPNQYNVLVKKYKNYLHVFVGEDPENKEYIGNNILIHVENNKNTNKYILIDGNIFSFKIDDKIIDFISPVGNSDVPYSYGIGKKNTYLMAFQQYYSNKYFNDKEDPYGLYYEKYLHTFKTKIIDPQ